MMNQMFMITFTVFIIVLLKLFLYGEKLIHSSAFCLMDDAVIVTQKQLMH